MPHSEMMLLIVSGSQLQSFILATRDCRNALSFIFSSTPAGMVWLMENLTWSGAKALSQYWMHSQRFLILFMSSSVALEMSTVLERTFIWSSKVSAICTTLQRCLQETCTGICLGTWLCWAIS